MQAKLRQSLHSSVVQLTQKYFGFLCRTLFNSKIFVLLTLTCLSPLSCKMLHVSVTTLGMSPTSSKLSSIPSIKEWLHSINTNPTPISSSSVSYMSSVLSQTTASCFAWLTFLFLLLVASSLLLEYLYMQSFLYLYLCRQGHSQDRSLCRNIYLLPLLHADCVSLTNSSVSTIFLSLVLPSLSPSVSGFLVLVSLTGYPSAYPAHCLRVYWAEPSHSPHIWQVHTDG